MNWTETRQRLLELLPNVELSEMWQPHINLRGAVLSRADLSDADLRGAVLSGAVLSRAVLSRAVLRDADLSGADLRGAVLSDAVLSRAVLRDADLSRAVLRDAVLSRADLTFTIGLWSFTAGMHSAYFQPSTGWLKIGCIEHQVAHWLENFEEIGQNNSYPPDAIRRYGAFIRMCAEAVEPAAQ